MYRRIAQQSHNSVEENADLREELTDRYGTMPDEVINLFEVVAIKKALIPLRIEKLERGPGNLVFSFMTDTPVKPELMLPLVAGNSSTLRLTPDGRLIVAADQETDTKLFEKIERIIAQLHKLTEEHVH